MLTMFSFQATCRHLNASGIHRRSFPDCLAALPPVPNIQSASETLATLSAHTFLLDSPASTDASMVLNDYQSSQVSSEYWKQCSGTHPINIYPPCLLRLFLFPQHLELISSRLYRRSQTPHYKLPLLGLFQVFLLYCLILLFLPIPLLFLLRLLVLPLLFVVFAGCHYLALTSSLIRLCSAAASHWICSKSSSGFEST